MIQADYFMYKSDIIKDITKCSIWKSTLRCASFTATKPIFSTCSCQNSSLHWARSFRPAFQAFAWEGLPLLRRGSKRRSRGAHWSDSKHSAILALWLFGIDEYCLKQNSNG
jgi:hypothetical protein